MSLNVKRQLEALAEKASEIPRLNHGGCCVFAALVAERLHAVGIPVWGVVSEHDAKADLNEVRLTKKPQNTVASWNAAGVWFRHVLVQFALDGKVWTYDSEGLVEGSPKVEDTCGGKLYSGNLTVSELNELAKSRGWSSAFDRGEIPRLRKLCDNYLSPEALL